MNKEHLKSVWRKNQADKIKREKEAGFKRKTVSIPAAYEEEFNDFVIELKNRWRNI